MRIRMVVVLAGFALVLAGVPAGGHAQGKGGGKGHGSAAAVQGGGGRPEAVARPQGGGRGQADVRPRGGQQGAGQAQAQARPSGAQQSSGRGQAKARPSGAQQGGGRAQAQRRAPTQDRGGSARAPRGGAGNSAGRGNVTGGNAVGGERGAGNAKAGGGRGASESRANAGGGPAAAASRGNAGNAGSGRGVAAGTSHAAERARAREALNRLPQHFRALQGSERRSDRFVLGATALAAVRGLDPDALDVRRSQDRVEVRNRHGDVLLDLDDDDARNLGAWDLRLLGDRMPTDDAPAFCRSGAGHPVWGREWCLDRGYGLGRTDGRLWSRTTNVTDIIFRQPSTLYAYRYDRPSLLQLLGSVVLDRLSLHALSLGFDQPLVGSWVAQPQAPRLLLIGAGPQPVAELVDLNGDGRVDVLYVTESGW